jgi:hypothetical protein
MKKFLFFFLLFSFALLFGCASSTIEEKKDLAEQETVKKEVITITEEEFERYKEDVAQELKEGEDLIEKAKEKAIFEFLLEEELQRGYPIFVKELKRLGKEVPSYEESRDYLEEFFLSHKDGARFLWEFEELKKEYLVEIE